MGWVDHGPGCSRTLAPRKRFNLLLPDVPSLSEALRPFSAVVVTGGSSGIGKSFIQLMRNVSPDLMICNLSRRLPAKNSSGNPELKLNHFPCDLTHPAELERAAAEVIAFLGRSVPSGRILLINNSGFGAFGRFADLDPARQLAMIDLNVRAVVHLTGLFLPTLRARGGAIMNIASTVAYQPTAFAATYGASKAFVLHWTLALNEELRGSNVRALAVCPGTTTTDFFRTAGLGDDAVIPSLSMTTDAVVESALRALAAGKAQIVPGWKNKLYTFVGSRLPKPLVTRIAAKVMARFRLGRRKERT
ncbi:MAG: SDR family NAD(P)-dependent oxidoreductase [Opitutaceae bacterium]|nr:SDR family NAD(P)-dependent oxidoreductase [Opitutaceae bacterium]